MREFSFLCLIVFKTLDFMSEMKSQLNREADAPKSASFNEVLLSDSGSGPHQLLVSRLNFSLTHQLSTSRTSGDLL